jgi:hypothetical protein
MAAFLSSKISPVKMVSHSSTTVGPSSSSSASSSSASNGTTDNNFFIIDVRDPSLYDRYALISSINFPKADYMVKDRILGDLYIARNKKQQIILVDQGTPHGVQNTCNDAELVGNKLVLTGFYQDVYVLTGGLARMAEEYPFAFEGPDVPLLIKKAQEFSVSKLPKRVPLTAPRGTKLVQGKLILPSSTTVPVTNNKTNNTVMNRSTKPNTTGSHSFGSPASTDGIQNEGYLYSVRKGGEGIMHNTDNDVPSIASILHPKMNNNANGRSNSIVSHTTMKTTMTNTTTKTATTSPVKGAVCVSILGTKNHSTFGTSNRFSGRNL